MLLKVKVTFWVLCVLAIIINSFVTLFYGTIPLPLHFVTKSVQPETYDWKHSLFCTLVS